jgi:hypothetical protein
MSLKKFIVVLNINTANHKEALENEIRDAIECEMLARQRVTPEKPDGETYFIGTVEEVRQINP